MLRLCTRMDEAKVIKILDKDSSKIGGKGAILIKGPLNHSILFWCERDYASFYGALRCTKFEPSSDEFEFACTSLMEREKS